MQIDRHPERQSLDGSLPGNSLSDILAQCMHCGLCLAVCPTYQLTKKEIASPRGRIRLVHGMMQRDLPPSETFQYEMNFCLGCYACMSACPAGVRYNEILETGRRMLPPNRLKKAMLRFFFMKKSRLKKMATMARPILSVMQQLLSRFTDKAWLFPVPQKKCARDILPKISPAIGPLRARVALFTGCVMDIACASIHADTVHVLTRNGCEVHLVDGEECCGALLGHTGDHKAAQDLARRNVQAFAQGFDAIVVNAAGCGAYLKKYESLLGGMGKTFATRVQDVQEFLHALGPISPTHPIPKKVVIQEPCHLIHAQKVSAQVSDLLKRIPGIQILPLEGARDCCGSAGIYNITHHRDSIALLDAKMDRIAQTGADIVVAANPGCLFQLRCGVQRRGLAMEVLHPMSLLAQAYRCASATAAT